MSELGDLRFVNFTNTKEKNIDIKQATIKHLSLYDLSSVWDDGPKLTKA